MEVKFYRCLDVNCVCNGHNNPFVTHLQTLKKSKCKSQSENNGRKMSWGTLPNSQHF